MLLHITTPIYVNYVIAHNTQRAMSVSLEKQIKDRHGYVAVFLYMICQGASFF